MADLSPVQQLIADHINARAEHDRLFNLEDWKLVDGKVESEALDAADDALVALCAGRPETEEDRKLWIRYLSSIDIPQKIDGCRDLTGRVIAVLIGDGKSVRMTGGERNG